MTDNASQSEETPVTIRRVQTEDIPKAVASMEDWWVHVPKHLHAPRWRWEFLDNPHRGQSPLCFWLMEQNAKVMGMIGAVPTALHVHGQYEPAVCMVDFVINPGARGGGLGSKLAGAMTKDVMDMGAWVIALGVRGVHESVEYYVLKKKGYQDMGYVPTFFRILDYQACLKEVRVMDKKKGARFLRKTLAAARVPGILLQTGDAFFLNKKETLYGRTVKTVQEFDASLDEVWAGMKKKIPFVARRDKEALDWRFFQCPVKSYKIVRAEDSKGRVAGYAVYRTGDLVEHEILGTMRVGTLVDMVVDPEDSETMAALIAKVIEGWREEKCAAAIASFSFLSAQKMLLRMGFRETTSSLLTMIKPPPSREDESLGNSLQAWWLSRKDSDLDLNYA